MGKINNLKIWIKRIILLFTSTVIVFFIKPPFKHYTIKDFEKYAKENNIAYEIEKCPRCGAEVADKMDFCYECNIILHTTDKERIQLFDYINEQTNKNLESTIRTEKRNKVIFYILTIAIVYKILGYILKFLSERLINS